MNLHWLDRTDLGVRDIAGAVAVREAARQVDSPHLPSQTVATFTGAITQGWDGEPAETLLARDESGRVTGVAHVTLPRWDNKHLGFVEVTVDPLRRRRGIGGQLYDAAVARVRAEGKSMVLTESWDQPGPVAFAKARGLDLASSEVQRRQRVLELDWDRLDREYAAATEKASDYVLVFVAGRVPDELVDPLVTLNAAINDAPIDDLDVEDEVFSPARLREFEESQRALGRRCLRVIARHRGTGELAGHTVMGVDEQMPWVALQYDTSVLRGHRGHRLGLLLKIAMLRWMAVEEPGVREVFTWNAASNAHMIEVNEVLGYEVVATACAWQRHF